MTRQTEKWEKADLVNDLLAKVGLRREASTLVSKLSGGERRRLGVAEELIRNPLFLFCDEPTTGLDSFNAFSVIKTLSSLTAYKLRQSSPKYNGKNIEMQIFKNRTKLTSGKLPSVQYGSRKGVICSIHQPSSEVFELFTHIILLKAGRVIYQGTTDDAIIIFAKLGIHRPRKCNPADFYVELMSEELTATNFSNVIENNYKQYVSPPRETLNTKDARSEINYENQ